MRRTTTHDSVRHEGMRGPVTVTATGRDRVYYQVGPCTHLNDTVRALEDVPALARVLPVPSGQS